MPAFLWLSIRPEGCLAKLSVKTFSVESVDPSSFTFSRMVAGAYLVIFFITLMMLRLFGLPELDHKRLPLYD
jgi:hypothetical protein